MEIPGCDQLELVTRTERSQTYRALRRLTGESVSVRVWPVALPDERLRRRFLRDAEQASHLPRHPALARIEDAGFANDGRPFVVTEPLPQQTLADVLPVDGPMPVGAALHLGVVIADAVAAAHDAGEVHSHIDPSVVFLAAGAPVLSDFGTVCITEALARATGPAPRPRYFAAPEQLERGAVGIASDVYSLGAIVYAALAGRAPHERFEPGAPESAALVLLRTLQAELPPIDRADVPTPLIMALRQALDPDPSARTASARTFATALQDVQRANHREVTEPAREGVAASGHRPGPRASQRAGAGSPPVGSPAGMDDHWPGASPSMGPPAGAPTSPAWPTAPRLRDRTADDGQVPADKPPSQMLFHPIEDETPRPAEEPQAPRPPAEPQPPATAPAPQLPPPRRPPLRSPAEHGRDQAPASPRPPARSTTRRLWPVGLVGGALVVAVALAASGVLSDDDPPGPGPGPTSTEAPNAAVPTGLGALESPAGVQLDWEGVATSTYAVLVMSETTAPTVLTADDGPGFLVPSAELRTGVGYCFAVADMAALDTSGGDTEAAFSTPVCIRGASEDTVRKR